MVQTLRVDTDVFSYLMRGTQEAERFKKIVEDRLLAISFATVGEAYSGAAQANWGESRLQRLTDTLNRYVILPGTFEIARQFGDIKARHRDQVDEGDIWIAATASVHRLSVATNNLRHFQPMSERFQFGIEHPNLDSGG
ncbi:PIN domain-containing protein [Candidatus Poriferisodalis sp.]|uniref:PIN domain-containing protein n=1 Tax=Candidatus Poriferisodalis sp. TaxID=3101277 RepID=UPI003B0206C2